MPNMKTQFRNTLHTRAKIDVYIIGFVTPMPSVVKRKARKINMPGAPSVIICTYSAVMSRNARSILRSAISCGA